MRWLQATTRRRCWSSSGISSVSYTKVKVLYDSCLLDGSGFLSKIDLSLLQLEDFSAPIAAILSGIQYTRTHMMCELQVWISLQWEVGRFFSPPCSNSLRNSVHWDTYDVVWISLQFEVGGFLSPQFKNSIRNWYTGTWMMCELLVWISLQLEVGIPPCSNSLRNWVHSDAYDVWITCVD